MDEEVGHHPLCAAESVFKNTSLSTNVYLNDFRPVTACSRLTGQHPEHWGRAAREAGHANHASPHILQAFIQTPDVSDVPE